MMELSPAAQALLADLADGYRIEIEAGDGWDSGTAWLRKTKPYDPVAHHELARAGLLDTAANGSGSAWLNDNGRAVHAEGHSQEKQ